MQLTQQLQHEVARIEKLIHLGCMTAADECLPDPILELLDEEDEETLQRLFPGLLEWVDAEISDELDSWLSEWAHDTGRIGFVAKIATPVMRHIHADGSGPYSWSNYYTHWVYGDTLEEAVQQGLAWVAEIRHLELKKNQGATK